MLPAAKETTEPDAKEVKTSEHDIAIPLLVEDHEKTVSGDVVEAVHKRYKV